MDELPGLFARCVAGLVGKGNPVVRGVPRDHRRDEQRSDANRQPATRLAQQPGAVRQQQHQASPHRNKHRRVFAQTTKPQNHTQGRPQAQVLPLRRAAQTPAQPHHPTQQRQQQGVWHQGQAQQMRQRCQQPQNHRSAACMQDRWELHLRQLGHPGGCQHPAQHGHHAHQQVTATHCIAKFCKRPLQPARQRRVVKITPLRVGRKQGVVGFVGRQVKGQGQGQVQQHACCHQGQAEFVAPNGLGWARHWFYVEAVPTPARR